jgi:hypothetical protein
MIKDTEQELIAARVERNDRPVDAMVLVVVVVAKKMRIGRAGLRYST